MAEDPIDKILKSRQQTAAAQTPAETAETEASKFYSLLRGDVVDDPFLEFRFRDGFRLCLPYKDVSWLSLEPKQILKIDFGSTLIVITGRGLDGELFDGIRNKRVQWIREATVEMEDNDSNPLFIADIDFEAEEAPAE